MPTLQEVANRNANARRGVMVYSPTRALPAGPANAGTARRILNSRQGQQPSWNTTTSFDTGTSTLPDYTPPQQPGNGRTALDDILDSMGTGQPPAPEEPGGWRGVLGTVANSVPGRAFFTALDFLDRPRRAVAATVAEGLDALGLNAESRTNSDASWSDWWNQFNDPTFGFGDIVASTGNKWLDRGIGLAGDLAMDPLNYLTGSGVIAGTGARARVGLAARSFGAGIAPETAARVGRFGLQSLDNVERRAINLATDGAESLLDRGYYFRLPFTDARMRVPGSGPVEQMIGGTFARARNAVTSTRPMSTVRYWRSERGLQDAIGKLLTGRGDISFGVAAALVNYRKGAGIAGSRVNGLLAAEWDRMVKRYGQQGLQDMVHEAETVGGTALNAFYNMAADLLEREGLRRPSFPNYVPHVFTDEAIAWMRGTTEGKAFHNELFKEIDFDDLSPHMLQRRLVGAGADGKPRSYVLNGALIEIKEGTIRELNEQFAKAMPDASFKLLDDDIANISARYSKSITGSVAEAGGLLYLANQARGLVRYADDDAVLTDIVNAAETAKLNEAAHATVKRKLSAAQELVAALTKQRDEGIVSLHGPVAAHMGKLVDTMDSLTKQTRAELKDLLARQANLSAQRDALANAPLEYTENAARLAAATDAAFQQLDDEYQKASARLAAIEPAFRIAEEQWLRADQAAKAARAAGEPNVPSPKMSAVQKEYRKGVTDMAQLAIDRDAAATLDQRIKALLRKEQIIERNMDSDTFMARAGAQMGLDSVDTMPPIRYVDPDTGTVQWIDPGTQVDQLPGTPDNPIELRRMGPEGAERLVRSENVDPRRTGGRTPAAVYAEHNTRRAQAIAPHEENFPALRIYQNQIEAQTGVVLAAREDMFNAASLSARQTQAAHVHLIEMRQVERNLTAEIEKVLGKPEKRGKLKELQARLAALRGVHDINVDAPDMVGDQFFRPYVGDERLHGPWTEQYPDPKNGALGRALRAYVDAQRPVTQARQKYRDELNKLTNLKRLQDQEAMKIRYSAPDDQMFGARARYAEAGTEVIEAKRRVDALREAMANAAADTTPPAAVDPRLAAELNAAQLDLQGAVNRAKQARAEVDRLRRDIPGDEYYVERMRELDARNNAVNRQLHNQVEGQRNYRRSAKGKQEAKLHAQRREVEADANDTERRLAYWKNSDAGGPWRTVQVTQRADGTYEVTPLWRTGDEADAAVELAVKREWFTTHYIDKTAAEVDVVAADLARARDALARAWSNRSIAKLTAQVDALAAKHQRLTQRLRRFRNFAHDKYDRRIATHSTVSELVARRNAQVIEAERITSELAGLGDRLAVFEENISRLRGERDAVFAERAELVERGARALPPPGSETLYGRRLREIHHSERNAMSVIGDNTYGYKLDWEPVAPIFAPRADVWTAQERTTLSIAYAIERAWDELPADARTAEFKAQRDQAVRIIRDLTSPNKIRGGESYANQYLRNIIEQYDDDGLTAAYEQLQRDRIPFKPPTQRSPLGKALAKGSGAGDRSPAAIARRALKLHKDLVENYGEQFIERGIIPVGEMRYWQHKAIELQDTMNAFSASARGGGGASPTLVSKRDQLAHDLNRFSEVMFTLRAAHEEGGVTTPSNALTAFIVHERLDKEYATTRTEWERTQVALGNKTIASEDAVAETNRQIAINKMDKAEMEWETLRDELSPEVLGREMSPDEARVLKNARARYTNRRKAVEKIAPTPMASVVSDEVDHIVYFVEQYISDLSAAFTDMKMAREIIWNQASPIRRARQLDASMEVLSSSISRAESEIEQLRGLVQEARAAGGTHVTYVPYLNSREFMMTPQEVLDEIAGKTRDKITQQQEGKLAAKARKALDEGDPERVIRWKRQTKGSGVERTLSLYEATDLIRKDEAALVSQRWSLESQRAEKAAVSGTSARMITHFDQMIQDQVRPPYLDVLRGELRDMEFEINRRFPPQMSDRERMEIQLRRDRIEMASNPPMTEGELDALRRKRDLYADWDERVRTKLGEEAAYIGSFGDDDGAALFTDIVTGARPVRQSDIDKMTNLFGNAEEAELATMWVQTFRQLLDVVKRRHGEREYRAASPEMLAAQREVDLLRDAAARGEDVAGELAYAEQQLASVTTAHEELGEMAERLDREEVRWIVDELRSVTGDSDLNNRFAKQVEESIWATGWEATAEELEANAARAHARDIGAEAYTAGERVNINENLAHTADTLGEVPLPSSRDTISIGKVRNEIVSALIASSIHAKDTAMADASRMMRLLGFDNHIQATRKIAGETMTGAQATARQAVTPTQRLSIMGYSVSKQVYEDPEKLRRFVTEMLHGTDYDYSHALRRHAQNLGARMARINMMRRALGASIDESAERVADPDRFLGLLTKWREPPVHEPELGGDVLDRITDFNTNVLPPEMEQVYSDRISQLRIDFAAAVRENDNEAIERLGPQIRELNEAAQRDMISNLGSEMPGMQIAMATPTGTEAAAAQAAAESMAQVPPNVDALAAQQAVPRAQAAYDEARAALAAAEAQMGGGGPLSMPNPDAPTQARTLTELIEEDGYELAPGNKLTRAQYLQRQDQLNAELKALPELAADRTPEQELQRRTILADLGNLSSKIWRDEEEWQRDAANYIYELERNGTPLPWDIATGEGANQETLERLRANVARAESDLAATKSTADATHLGPGDATAGELADTLPAGPSAGQERRAELQAQADAARAAGDENAARWAEQQMGWLDEPEEAVQPATISPVERHGVADPVIEPDPLPPPPMGLPQQLDRQWNELVEEFRTHLQKYGSYDAAPDEIKQRMAALSASAKKLSEDRRNMRARDAGSRAQTLKEVPELAAVLERAGQVTGVVPPTISADVWQVMRAGPSQRTFDPALEAKLKPLVKIDPNLPAVRTVGEVFPTQRSPRNAILRGNVSSTGDLRLRAQREEELLAQMAASPGRIVQTARERMISRLNEMRAERLALQDELLMASPELGPPAPLIGPAMPEMTPDQVAATARGERDRLAPELQAAMAEEFQSGQRLQAAKAQRAADAAEIAKREAADARTQQLADLDMDLAKIRTDVANAEAGAEDWTEFSKKVKSGIGAVNKNAKVKSPQVQDLLDLASDINNLKALDPDEAKVIAALLDNARKSQEELDRATQAADALDATLKSFGKDPAKAKIAGEVMQKAVADGWSEIARKLLRDENATLSAAGKAAGLRANQSVVIAQDLKARLERVTKLMETPEAWKLVDKYTAFFKTYATGRPGFHVRNALSAIFMNLVDGVRIRDMYAGMSAWRAFTKAPREFWDNADQKTRDAISAVLASGAGGQFTERGLASAGSASSRAYRAIMNNRFTRFNQRAGTLVEGSARMGMALNSVHRGQDLAGMVDRITKYHFNYRELSSMDVTARRYIPFWTFMSRNLPLQLEQMWLRPQMYLRYQSLVRNFAETPDPFTPEYWLGQGAFTLDENAAETDSPWYLAPDLPHLRVAEPFEAMASGDWGKALLSDINPLFMAPTEAFAFNKKVYTGAPIEGEYVEPSNVMKPLLPLLAMLGGTEQGASGQTVVDDRYAHVARSLLPPLELLERLTVHEGTRAGRQGETWARTFGAPVLRLTPELRRQTQRSRRAEQREQRQTQAQLARL